MHLMTGTGQYRENINSPLNKVSSKIEPDIYLRGVTKHIEPLWSISNDI